jgi:pyridoxamine 5'-phosphate oxidase
MNPFVKIQEWLNKETELGSYDCNRVILATASKKGIPHSRVVAIREINEQGVLFFTQRGSRKVVELNENPFASMTLWLPAQQREVILDGHVQTLNSHENIDYWNALPRDRQLRFNTYGPTSGKIIHSLTELENKYAELSAHFHQQKIPISESYCGYRLIPETIYFYTLGTETFSEVVRCKNMQEKWLAEMLSP